MDIEHPLPRAGSDAPSPVQDLPPNGMLLPAAEKCFKPGFLPRTWMGAKRWLLRALLFISVSAALGYGIGGLHVLDNVLVLAILAITTGAGIRSAFLLLGAILTWAAFPCVELPTYWICLVPLIWLWRYLLCGQMWSWEAFAVGFAMTWFVAPFLRSSFPLYGLAAQIVCCAVIGLQTLLFAAGLRLSRNLPAFFAATVSAFIGTGCEVLQACAFGGVCRTLSLPAATTPLAQWAYFVGPFGVSFLLYLVNVLWLPDWRLRGPSRWMPTAAATLLAAAAWLGGVAIRSHVAVSPLPFAALIVQPRSDDIHRHIPRWRVLDHLTTTALLDDDSVDLIVWPESAVSTSIWADHLTPRPQSQSQDDAKKPPVAIQLADFYERLMPRYHTPCLAGAAIQTPSGPPHNSACLLCPDGTASRYDKTLLVPIAEGVPEWWPDGWLRVNFLSLLGVTGTCLPGRDFHLLEFQARNGRRIRLAISICYEMHFPWLPQFRQGEKADAVVHLTNETWCKDYPSYWQFETWACQYRAIETRTWQLVSTTIGNSAVIDPRGAIRDSLAGKAGVLRTQSLFEGYTGTNH
jgi:apolipoprotein N-acyltransferase